MGHLVGKDIYRRLGKKIDSLTVRAPWNDALYAILKELYSPEEAEIIVRMPYGFSRLEDIQKNTGFEPVKLQNLLDGLADKGLLIDMWHRNAYRYSPSPMVVGIFEFTLMRTGGNLNSREWARLFHDYLHGDLALGLGFAPDPTHPATIGSNHLE